MVGIAIFVLLARSPTRWEGWRPASCMPDRCFCEAVREGSIRQPANTASGLVFLPAAAVVLAMASRRRRRGDVSRKAVTAQPMLVAIFAAATLLIGLGSAFYHASLSFWGQTADVLGMYLIATLLVLFNTARLWNLSKQIVGPLYLLANAALLWSLVAMPQTRRYAFAVLVMTALGLELAIRSRQGVSGQPAYFRRAVYVLLFGFTAWTLDITHTLCRPTSYLQGHAVWHVAGAVALVLVFMHYAPPASRDVDVLP
jgi:hypothetical protein